MSLKSSVSLPGDIYFEIGKIGQTHWCSHLHHPYGCFRIILGLCQIEWIHEQITKSFIAKERQCNMRWMKRTSVKQVIINLYLSETTKKVDMDMTMHFFTETEMYILKETIKVLNFAQFMKLSA